MRLPIRCSRRQRVLDCAPEATASSTLTPVIGLVLSVLAGGGIELHAQETTGPLAYTTIGSLAPDTVELRRQHELAEYYAPNFWFAPGERFFPMNPFHLAFDGVGNDFDPSELAPLSNDGTKLSRETLLRVGNGPTDGRWVAGQDTVPRNPTIFYDVRDLDSREVDRLWLYLRSDEQSWERIGKIAVAGDPALVAEGTVFQAIQYYLYFPADFGLQGHEWDLEVFAIILPKDPALAGKFRLYIGAGHTTAVANNMLLVTKTNAEEFVHALVEYGDHSLATDAGPPGVFTSSVDVNWHIADAWGLRDIQSKSGLAATGGWGTEMADDRRGTSSVVYVPECAPVCRPPSARIDDASASEQKYKLIPARPLDVVFNQLWGTQSAEDVSDVGRDVIGYYFEAARRLVITGAAYRPIWDTLSDTEQLAAIEALALWQDGLYLDPDGTTDVHTPEDVEDAESILPWRNKHYQNSPGLHLKAHLFRPVFGSWQRIGHVFALVRPVVTLYPDRGIMYQVGVDFPAFFTGPKIRGFLQLQAGAYCDWLLIRDDCAVALSAMHTSSYSGLVSWYVRVSFVPGLPGIDRPGVVTANCTFLDLRNDVEGCPLEPPTALPESLDPESGPSNVLMGGGVALKAGAFRIRAGFATEATTFGLQFGRTSWELMFEPFRLDIF